VETSKKKKTRRENEKTEDRVEGKCKGGSWLGKKKENGWNIKKRGI